MYERDNLVKQVVQLRKEVTEQAQQHQQSESQRVKLDTELNEIRVGKWCLCVLLRNLRLIFRALVHMSRRIQYVFIT